MSKARQHSIAVSLRVRPFGDGGVGGGCLSVGEDGGVLVEGRAYGYAHSVITGSDQEAAHRAICAPLIERLNDGFSCTLLAYGQTGSGKTHTVFGPPGCLTEAALEQSSDGGTPPAWGLFPRTVLELLNSNNAGGSLHASAIEVYQDKAYDLLAERKPLTVGSKSSGTSVGKGPVSGVGCFNTGEEAVGGTHPPGCTCSKCWQAGKEALAARLAKRDAAQHQARASNNRSLGAARTSSASTATAHADTWSTVGEALWPLKTPADVARLARTVEVTRVAQGHLLNARSSRSHCLVHVHLTRQAGDKVSKRQFLFVDLAGSERIAKSGAEGNMKKQAMSINSSLTALGKVIRALGNKDEYVPYRDSTLTMLLRNSFGGKACTGVLIALSSDPVNAEETACSLEFGKRISIVRNTATVVIGQDVKTERVQLERELAAVRLRLEKLEAEGKGGRFGSDVPVSEQRGFELNVQRLEEEEHKATRAKQELSEARARGRTAEEAEISARVARAAAEANNLRDIIFRQKTIAGFWIPPAPNYTSSQAEAKRIEASLQLLYESSSSGMAAK